MPRPSLSTLIRGLSIIPQAAGVAGGLAIGVAAMNNLRAFQDDLGTGRLTFPLDLERFAISMCFSFMEYQRRSIFNQPYLRASSTIRLPVAKSIVDKFKMRWDESEDDPLVGAAIESLLSENGAKIFEAGVWGSAVQAAQAAIAGGPVGLTLNKVLQPFGVATNPFLTVLFKQPTFKRHSFTWKLIPKNPEEARQINAIIQTFKYHMLPEIVAGMGGTMLSYPEIVKISFYNFDDYLYRFKPCVLENMTVNYASGSQGPSFFKGDLNVPTEIDLQLDFLEIEYWTKDDMNPAWSDPAAGLGGGGYVSSTSLKP